MVSILQRTITIAYIKSTMHMKPFSLSSLHFNCNERLYIRKGYELLSIELGPLVGELWKHVKVKKSLHRPLSPRHSLSLFTAVSFSDLLAAR